jgi:hypothetical protein|tara:strand:- start:156 stop:479 length:324 start_codon:yes stop_codon:yes gene_type:complete
MKYARIQDGVVHEIIDDGGKDISEMFHPDIVATLVPDDGTAVVNGTWDGSTFGPVPPPPKPNYMDDRRKEYGPIGDQLDQQYWDSVNGTTVWPDHIAKVKSDYPKPT